MHRRDFLSAVARSTVASSFAAPRSRADTGGLRESAGAGRAEGRQRRPQYAGAVRRSRVLRAAPEDRDRARPGVAARRPRRACIPRSRRCCRCGRARARGAAGRGLPGRQPVAFPLDRDLGHRVESSEYLQRRLAHARVLRRRRRRDPSPRTAWSSAAPNWGRSRAAARARSRWPTPNSSCARRGSRRRRRDAGNAALAAHSQGRARHRAGGGAASMADYAFAHRISAHGRSATRSAPRPR